MLIAEFLNQKDKNVRQLLKKKMKKMSCNKQNLKKKQLSKTKVWMKN